MGGVESLLCRLAALFAQLSSLGLPDQFVGMGLQLGGSTGSESILITDLVSAGE